VSREKSAMHQNEQTKMYLVCVFKYENEL
jgi:hypothetical protein